MKLKPPFCLPITPVDLDTASCLEETNGWVPRRHGTGAVSASHPAETVFTAKAVQEGCLPLPNLQR